MPAITWTNLVNATVSGTTLSKTAGANDTPDAGARRVKGELTGRLLRYVLDNPGLTAWELSEQLGANYPTIASRLHRLHVNGRVLRRKDHEARGHRYYFVYYVSHFVYPTRLESRP